MERNVDMAQISDGKKYTSNDLAKLGCGDCAGCSKCCHGMGESIILDPYDIYSLTTNLETTFSELIKDKLSLSVADMIILPHLNLKAADEGCLFPLMRMADAAYIHSDRGYAGFFRLAGFMRMKVLAIFCR